MTSEVPGTTHVLSGLEPDNLLAFLALLGLLRSLEAMKLQWKPRIAWRGMPLVSELYLAQAVAEDEMLATAEAGIVEIGRAYDFDRPDITYAADEFRTFAEDARHHRERARLVAALGCDSILRRDSDVIEPSPLCAMFGQGHQHFLSRLEAAAARDHPANASDLSRALFDPWRYDDDTDGFRWDPIEDRRYALQFGDPSENRNKIGTVAGANRLAAIGFGVLACVPTNRGLETIGVVGEPWERDVCWPLTTAPASLAGHLALVAHPYIGDEQKALNLKPYGVSAIARARRYRVGKFFNFERARLQIL